MAIIKTSNKYIRFSDAKLVEFTDLIVEKMTGNPNFPNPIVDPAALTTENTAYKATILAAANGDRIAIAKRREQRQQVIDLLLQQAAYVQAVAAGNVAILLSSGFDAVSTNRTQIELPQPVILSVENTESRQLQASVTAISTAKAYETQTKTGNGDWTPGGIFTQSRRMTMDDLIPGNTYMVRARAIGGSTGFSPWSDPVSRMCT